MGHHPIHIDTEFLSAAAKLLVQIDDPEIQSKVLGELAFRVQENKLKKSGELLSEEIASGSGMRSDDNVQENERRIVNRISAIENVYRKVASFSPADYAAFLLLCEEIEPGTFTMDEPVVRISVESASASLTPEEFARKNWPDLDYREILQKKTEMKSMLNSLEGPEKKKTEGPL